MSTNIYTEIEKIELTELVNLCEELRKNEEDLNRIYLSLKPYWSKVTLSQTAVIRNSVEKSCQAVKDLSLAARDRYLELTQQEEFMGDSDVTSIWSPSFKKHLQ